MNKLNSVCCKAVCSETIGGISFRYSNCFNKEGEEKMDKVKVFCNICNLIIEKKESVSVVLSSKCKQQEKC